MADEVATGPKRKRGPIDPNSPAGIRNAWAKAEREYHEQAKKVAAATKRLSDEKDELARCEAERHAAAKRMTDSLASALGASAVVPPKDGAA